MMSRWSRSVAVLGFLAVTTSIAHAQDSKDDSSSNATAAWIGVSIESGAMDSESGARGVRIGEIEAGGPADRAGVRVGDLVTQVDGRAVREPDAFVRAIRAHDAGKRIRLTIVRDGRTKSLEVTSGSAPEETQELDQPEASGEVMRLLEPRSRPRLGVEVMSLDEDLAPYFDGKAGQGVLVTRVVPGSGADEAGIKAGDVLLTVDDRDLADVEDLHTAVQNREAGDKVEVALRRRGRAEKAQVEIGAAEIAMGSDPMRRWTQRRSLPGAFSSSGDIEALRRELRELKRDMDALKRDLRDRR